jgi:hypothetical protein
MEVLPVPISENVKNQHIHTFNLTMANCKNVPSKRHHQYNR